MPEPPQEPDKVEDFASLWKKQKETSSKSVIGEFMTRIEGLEAENIKLRSTIQRDIDLITKTESIVKKAIEDKEQLEKEIRAKEEKLKEKTEELSMIKIESSVPSSYSEQTTPALTQADLAVNISLIEDLQSQLSKRKSQIKGFENLIKINDDRIQELTKANESLNAEIESKASTGPLEQLCKDLQEELNRYKKTVAKLKEENKTLKEDAEKSAQKGKIATLKRENEELKEESSRVKSQLVAFGSIESEFEDLQKLVKEKDKRIDELNATIASQPQAQTGAISGLVDELQGKINKLKNALSEKNKIIESLKNP